MTLQNVLEIVNNDTLSNYGKATLLADFSTMSGRFVVMDAHDSNGAEYGIRFWSLATAMAYAKYAAAGEDPLDVVGPDGTVFETEKVKI